MSSYTEDRGPSSTDPRKRPNRKPKVGDCFGSYVVVGDAYRHAKRDWRVPVRCVECGLARHRLERSLRYGNGNCSACARSKHGHARKSRCAARPSPTYVSWQAMVARCTNPEDPGWHRYGGRGITVCARWRHFTHFLEDMGERPAGTSIDRIDNSGGYEPGNCRWADVSTQSRNRRTTRNITAFGVTRCLKDWSTVSGLSTAAIAHRLNCGWPPERALTQPLRGKAK